MNAATDSAPKSEASPPGDVLAHLRAELRAAPPFSLMSDESVNTFLAHATHVHFAPGQQVLAPEQGAPEFLLLVRKGSVIARRGGAQPAECFEYVQGDLFPVDAVLSARPVQDVYAAHDDTVCLQIPAQQIHLVAQQSPLFAEHLNRRMPLMLDMARKAVQANWASQALAEQMLEQPLGQVLPKRPLTCSPTTSLLQALRAMHERRVGSVLVVTAEDALVGIFTRHDLLDRVTLPQLPLDTAIGDVMSKPVHALTVNDTLQDAALVMSRHAIRHVPVVERGRVVNLVSERDIFALQRLSLKSLSMDVRAAADLETLRAVANSIRAFAAQLLGQGVQARQLTELISHMNDVLTQRLIHLVAVRRQADLSRVCWLSFGSEGRSEQTVATDQDNGLAFLSSSADADRVDWMAFAAEVNDGLDACGYPLCKGGVMARNRDCCRTPDEWSHRFQQWIDHGAPEDLLQASIYFDMRPLAGNAALMQPLLEQLYLRAAANPRFIKQMVDNALRSRPPLNWRGALDTRGDGGKACLDLKRQGTALFVDAARVYALAHGLPVQGTRARMEAAAPRMRAQAHESEAWCASFEYLQMLRLQVQLRAPAAQAVSGGAPPNPNEVDVAALHDIDQRMLKEVVHMARSLQQRMELDYGR